MGVKQEKKNAWFSLEISYRVLQAENFVFPLLSENSHFFSLLEIKYLM